MKESVVLFHDSQHKQLKLTAGQDEKREMLIQSSNKYSVH